MSNAIPNEHADLNHEPIEPVDQPTDLVAEAVPPEAAQANATSSLQASPGIEIVEARRLPCAKPLRSGNLDLSLAEPVERRNPAMGVFL